MKSFPSVKLVSASGKHFILIEFHCKSFFHIRPSMPLSIRGDVVQHLSRHFGATLLCGVQLKTNDVPKKNWSDVYLPVVKGDKKGARGKKFMELYLSICV